MPTECSAAPFEFAPVEGRAVVAGFDGGAVTSDAGALLLGATDRAIRPVERFAGCFGDGREEGRVVHEPAAMVGRRVVGLALGDEDLNDHDHRSGPHPRSIATIRSRARWRGAWRAGIPGARRWPAIEHAEPAGARAGGRADAPSQDHA
jgi:Transposase DDE domain group 1